MDEPNHRSLHTAPVPRVGGIGVLAGILSGWGAIEGVPLHWSLLVLLLGAFSFLDDRFDLSAAMKFPVHLLAVALWMLDTGISEPWPVMLLCLILFAWMINLFNFMDGSNGLAGGMALFGFGSYGVAAWLAGDASFALTTWVVAAAAFGFLLFNFDPARVFLGDTGSIPLGFLAGTMGYAGWNLAFWPLWFPFLVFSPFIVDATLTLSLRIWWREKFWQAHNKHCYQRMIRSGWSHRRLALSAYMLMIACGGTALLIRESESSTATAVLLAWSFVYVVLLHFARRRWQQHQVGFQ